MPPSSTMTIDLPLGNTLPDMLLTVRLCVIVEKVRPTAQNRQ